MDHELELLECEKERLEEMASKEQAEAVEAIATRERRMQQQEEAHDREFDDLQAEKRREKRAGDRLKGGAFSDSGGGYGDVGGGGDGDDDSDGDDGDDEASEYDFNDEDSRYDSGDVDRGGGDKHNGDGHDCNGKNVVVSCRGDGVGGVDRGRAFDISDGDNDDDSTTPHKRNLCFKVDLFQSCFF